LTKGERSKLIISNSWKQSQQAVQQIYLLVNGTTNLFGGCWKEQREELTKGKVRGKYTSERNNFVGLDKLATAL
jgi:hypothetical protein